jgi:hypothetical protein
MACYLGDWLVVTLVTLFVNCVSLVMLRVAEAKMMVACLLML